MLEVMYQKSESEEKKIINKWYLERTAEEKNILGKIMEETARAAIFHFLCILDGAQVAENGKDKGDFLLYYDKRKELYHINDNSKGDLHDLFMDIQDK
jgi:superfamily I DNA and/or RNA helicase